MRFSCHCYGRLKTSNSQVPQEHERSELQREHETEMEWNNIVTEEGKQEKAAFLENAKESTLDTKQARQQIAEEGKAAEKVNA
jgi:hypothetical protein